jgi:predicted nuclease with TOPRIM domain
MQDPRLEEILARMQELLAESRRLRDRHDELAKEYAKLKREFDEIHPASHSLGHHESAMYRKSLNFLAPRFYEPAGRIALIHRLDETAVKAACTSDDR